MKKVILIASLIVVCVVVVVWPKQRNISNQLAPQGSMATINSKRDLELQGKRLYMQGFYDEALEKFKEADNPKYHLYPHSMNSYARSYMRRIYFIRGEYEKAIANAGEMLARRPDAQTIAEDKKMYESLIQWRDTSNPETIYQFIKELKTSHADMLPPNAYKFGATLYIANILRLYDTIGDYDAGIAYIDEILTFFRTGKAGDPKPGRVDAEHFKVREGFEQDKAEGKHGPEPGKPGRATQAIIQSEYFPG